EMPSVGAVIAYEFLSRRKPADFLPPYVALNFGVSELVNAGCLPEQAAPLALGSDGDSPFIVDQKEKESFERRWKLLRQLSATQGAAAASNTENWATYYQAAFDMMSKPAIAQILKIDPEDHKRYGGSA